MKNFLYFSYKTRKDHFLSLATKDIIKDDAARLLNMLKHLC